MYAAVFFIGVFGIDRARKQIGTHNNAICPTCGAMTRFDILKTCSYFHVFFIPVFRWDVKYYVKPACCESLCELDPDIGREYEKGRNPEIRDEHLQPINVRPGLKICSNCKARLEPGFSYCPCCGSRLND